jgi:hypothetical protein
LTKLWESPEIRNSTSPPKEIEIEPRKYTIIYCGKSGRQELNYSIKKMQLSIVARAYFRNLTFPQKKSQLWQVRTSEIELFPFPPKNAIVPKSRTQELNFSQKNMQLSQKKMQLSPSPASGIELFRPKKMQLSIVARPYFRNLTFPTKK